MRNYGEGGKKNVFVIDQAFYLVELLRERFSQR
jgi:hypothetical protein